MQTLETALANLYKQNLITMEDALAKASRPEDLKRMVSM
jgi:Tfp pilus assembly pilus retraction ATPase PilT